MTHPIVEATLRRVRSDGVLRDLPGLEAAFERALAGDDPVAAVKNLINFAVYLGEAMGFDDACRTLLGIACTATPMLELRACGGAELERRKGERTMAALGRPRERCAPRRDEPAPPDSVRMRRMLSARRRIIR